MIAQNGNKRYIGKLFGKPTEEVIPLKEIFNIKLTMTGLNNQNFWKIGYYDAHGIAKSVRILPKQWNGELEEIKVLVKAANPEVKIKNWSQLVYSSYFTLSSSHLFV